MDSSRDEEFMAVALEEARAGGAEGGIPIGACLVGADGQILARGRNKRVQEGSVIKHGEMDCLENAGRLTAEQYKGATLYTTLSPCDMCSGAVLFHAIPRVVLGEARTDYGGQEHLRARGVALRDLDSPECFALMQEFIRTKPHLWREDNGFKFQPPDRP